MTESCINKSAWEQRKFSKVFSFLRNNTLSRAELSESEGKTFNVHYGDILVKFGEVIDARFDVLPRIADDNLAERLSCQTLANGDVIIADTAEDETVGKCSELCGCGEQTVISGLHTMACRPMFEFASRYLGYCLNSPSFHEQLLPLMQGIKVISISKGSISDTKIRFPSVTEQRAIGQLLSSLDNLITLHQREQNMLFSHKLSLAKAAA
ncbi:MAG: restriction endonuclease subunit S [Atopobium sp.]|uniref:restriction endonuclease subunit S n=1 Tax=Atopobium sp. TaxID=1872650 RepID=UPI002A7577E8|nr:restriction endonuclease subunit S [Atopobium sp.]MDY2788021.1 restriction endonuclease subunit S [Atopobium sp.]